MQPQQSLKQLVTHTVSDGKRLLRAQVNLTTTELSQTTKTIGKISLLGLIAVSRNCLRLGGIRPPHVGRLPDRGGNSAHRCRDPWRAD